eukprot:3122523-Alexandrium_andersonii.AAC.1
MMSAVRLSNSSCPCTGCQCSYLLQSHPGATCLRGALRRFMMALLTATSSKTQFRYAAAVPSGMLCGAGA